MKDPNKTVERLTKALEAMATGVSAPHRAEAVLGELFPLLPSEFPATEDRALFERIISFDTSQPEISLEKYERFFNSVWDLYWHMSANHQYR